MDVGSDRLANLLVLEKVLCVMLRTTRNVCLNVGKMIIFKPMVHRGLCSRQIIRMLTSYVLTIYNLIPRFNLVQWDACTHHRARLIMSRRETFVNQFICARWKSRGICRYPTRYKATICDYCDGRHNSGCMRRLLRVFHYGGVECWIFLVCNLTHSNSSSYFIKRFIKV